MCRCWLWKTSIMASLWHLIYKHTLVLWLWWVPWWVNSYLESWVIGWVLPTWWCRLRAYTRLWGESLLCVCVMPCHIICICVCTTITTTYHHHLTTICIIIIITVTTVWEEVDVFMVCPVDISGQCHADVSTGEWAGTERREGYLICNTSVSV